MNQVPEIKEGLQFIDTQDEGNTVYTIDHLISLERGIHVTWEDADLGAWYPFHAVDKYFQKGTWKVVEPTIPLSTIFSSQPHNVVMTALEECAKEFGEPRGMDQQEALYDFLTASPEFNIPKIVDKIHQLGFTIIPK